MKNKRANALTYHWCIALTLGLVLWIAGTALAARRIVSTDGITTETLFALGADSLLVARYSGSLYPEGANKFPDIGLGHQVNPEAVLRLRPTTIIGRDRPMNQLAFRVLESADFEVLRLLSEIGLVVGQENLPRSDC